MSPIVKMVWIVSVSKRNEENNIGGSNGVKEKKSLCLLSTNLPGQSLNQGKSTAKNNPVASFLCFTAENYAPFFRRILFFLAEAKYFYFSADFRLKLFLWIFLDFSVWHFCFISIEHTASSVFVSFLLVLPFRERENTIRPSYFKTLLCYICKC